MAAPGNVMQIFLYCCCFSEGTDLGMCGDMLQLLRPLNCQEAVASSSRHILPQLGHSQGLLANV